MSVEYIAFKASDKKDNAVIAAKDADGNILWSWHIWLTDKPEDQVYNNDAGTMMDRNLGATSATKGDVGALGLLYQRGRKDPFLGSSSTNDTRWRATSSTKGLYDPCPSGYRVPDSGSTGIWSKAFGRSGYWTTSSNWDSTNMGMDFGSTDKTLAPAQSGIPLPVISTLKVGRSTMSATTAAIGLVRHAATTRTT